MNLGPEIFNRQTAAASELIDKWWGPGLTSEPGQAWLDIMPFTEQMENPDPQALRRAQAAQSLRSARREYGPHDKAPLPAGGPKPWHNEARGMVDVDRTCGLTTAQCHLPERRPPRTLRGGWWLRGLWASPMWS